jgi:hypothetical protein
LLALPLTPTVILLQTPAVFVPACDSQADWAVLPDPLLAASTTCTRREPGRMMHATS